MPCDGCNSGEEYTTYQGFKLCRRCYAVAERLLPLLFAESSLKFFTNHCDNSEFADRAKRLLEELTILKEEYAKEIGVREADDPIVNALRRLKHDS